MVDNAPKPMLACTEEAKRMLEDVIQRKPDSVVALLYGRRNSEDQEHWYIGYYKKTNLPATGRFCTVGDFELYFPQGWLLNGLPGQMVRNEDGEIVIDP